MSERNDDRLERIVRCSICDTGCAEGDDTKHLPLYCNGSEGITVCLACRMTLTEVARGMMRVASVSRMAGYKACKSVQKAKASNSLLGRNDPPNTDTQRGGACKIA